MKSFAPILISIFIVGSAVAQEAGPFGSSRAPASESAQSPADRCYDCMKACPHTTRDLKDCDRGCPKVCDSESMRGALEKANALVRDCQRPAGGS